MASSQDQDVKNYLFGTFFACATHVDLMRSVDGVCGLLAVRCDCVLWCDADVVAAVGVFPAEGEEFCYNHLVEVWIHGRAV